MLKAERLDKSIKSVVDSGLRIEVPSGDVSLYKEDSVYVIEGPSYNSKEYKDIGTAILTFMVHAEDYLLDPSSSK